MGRFQVYAKVLVIAFPMPAVQMKVLATLKVKLSIQMKVLATLKVKLRKVRVNFFYFLRCFFSVGSDLCDSYYPFKSKISAALYIFFSSLRPVVCYLLFIGYTYS